ncbi:LysR family transcriptional regulator [Nonomuraea sp. NPDC049480]|uniref:LysR family transcriptional regulator n=1 Tax=Nonomuraea sp. NPDC049480 TaxID=3364353 RepID=UPI00378C17B5
MIFCEWFIGQVDIQQLRYFVTVADELHFGRAAERLRISPSPLSRHIRALEHELGAELFLRRYHNVQLTRFGRDFLEHARDVVRRFDALKGLSRDRDAFAERRCHIGATPLAAPQILDAVLSAFHETAPETELPVTLESTADLLPKVTSGGIDLAVVHLPVEEPRLHALPLGQSTFAVAVRADDVLAGRSSVSLRDLKGRKVLTTSRKVHPTLLGTIQEAMIEAGIVRIMEIPNDPVQSIAHILHTGAVALTLTGSHPSARLLYDTPAIALIPLDEPRMILTAGLVWDPATEKRLPTVGKVLAVLRGKYGEHLMTL